MEHAIYLTYKEAKQCGCQEAEESPDADMLRQLRHMITNTTEVLGTTPRVIYSDIRGVLTDLDLPPCPHNTQDVNDRCLFVCLDCGEELGR